MSARPHFAPVLAPGERAARRAAFKEAADVVRRFRPRPAGDGPLLLLDVLHQLAQHLEDRR